MCCVLSLLCCDYRCRILPTASACHSSSSSCRFPLICNITSSVGSASYCTSRGCRSSGRIITSITLTAPSNIRPTRPRRGGAVRPTPKYITTPIKQRLPSYLYNQFCRTNFWLFSTCTFATKAIRETRIVSHSKSVL